jgi:antitoxin VapB
MAETTTVFQSGNSQAVRLPKEFRFKSKTVEIFRRGDEVVLRETPRSLGQMIEAAFAGLPPLLADDVEQFDAALALARSTQAPQERDWSWLEGDAPPRRERSTGPQRLTSKQKRPAR